MAPDPPSSPPAPVPAWGQRLVEQLQLLSEITENLTYRLLDLEERLIEAERQLGQQRDGSHGDDALPERMERWLLDTEERIARVEDLLSDSPAAKRAPPSGVGGRPGLELLAGRLACDGEGAGPFPAQAQPPVQPPQAAHSA